MHPITHIDFEFIAGAKMIGAGAASIGLAGAGVGIVLFLVVSLLLFQEIQDYVK